MKVLDLPPEILAEIFNNLSDAESWLTISLVSKEFSSRAFRLQRLESLSSNKYVSSNLIIRLKHLQSIHNTIIIRDSNDILQIARMPKLKTFILYLIVIDVDDFLDKIKMFISNYFREGRILIDKKFVINANTNGYIINKPEFTFIYDKIFNIWTVRWTKGEDLGDIINIDSYRLIEFIKHYRKYAPVETFTSYNMLTYDKEEISKLAVYLESIPELDTFQLFPYNSQAAGQTLYKMLKGKITTLGAKSYYHAIDKQGAFYNFDLLTDSACLQKCHLPIYVDYIDLLMNKYSGLKEVCIYYRPRDLSRLKDLIVKYPKLEKVLLFISKSETDVPRDLPAIFALYRE